MKTCFVTWLRTGRNISVARWLLCLLSFFTFSLSASAQPKTITGKITNDKGQPIQGVSIGLKISGTATVSGEKGDYSLNVSNSTSTLVFSSVGYVPKEVALAGSSTVNVVLENDVAGLNTVVVVGYGTQKKGKDTGSVSVISSEQMERRPNVSTSNVLQGLAPGVTVTSQTGAPGGDAGQIRIRGINSFGGSRVIRW